MALSLSYACINLSLPDLSTNRGMIRRTFDHQGFPLCSSLAVKNLLDLEQIIIWNVRNGFTFFRMSSDMFPWHSEYKLEQLPDCQTIFMILKRIGDFAKKHNHRLTFHPSPFDKLCSSDPRIVANTIRDLEQHSEIFDLMGFEPSTYNKVNIHVGGAYGDKVKTAQVFCRNFGLLSERLKKRLTVENDDKSTLYSVNELYDMIHKVIGIPIVFDYHHHKHHHQCSEQEAFELAYSTWGTKPVFHYSESAQGKKATAHSDFVVEKINVYDRMVDIIIEAKQKDLAVLEYIKAHQK